MVQDTDVGQVHRKPRSQESEEKAQSREKKRVPKERTPTRQTSRRTSRRRSRRRSRSWTTGLSLGQWRGSILQMFTLPLLRDSTLGRTWEMNLPYEVTLVSRSIGPSVGTTSSANESFLCSRPTGCIVSRRDFDKRTQRPRAVRRWKHHCCNYAVNRRITSSRLV